LANYWQYPEHVCTFLNAQSLGFQSVYKL